MNIETIKLPVAELAKGMMVVKLDRPWLETPFKLQGFRIQKDEELRLLGKYCRHVYVDVERGIRPPPGRGERFVLTPDGDVADVNEAPPVVRVSKLRTQDARSRQTSQYALPAAGADYPIAADFADELTPALAAIGATKVAVRDLMQELKHGARADLGAIKAGAAALEESMLRNPDPALLSRALATDEPFSLRHCVNSAILAIALGRELGMKRQPIHELTMGVLLADIGKMRLPKELLRTTRRLTRRENEIIKLHVKYGVEMADALGGLTPGTIEIIGSHHERFDGSGYPEGLIAGELSLAVRIAGLADSFDAITSDRTYSSAIPVHEALQELYAANIEIFQRDLVDRLIQALGAHPVGTLVALSDGSVAVVIARNRQRRLLPRVMRLTDSAKVPLEQRAVLDLALPGDPQFTVRDVVEAGAYGIPAPTMAMLTA